MPRIPTFTRAPPRDARQLSAAGRAASRAWFWAITPWLCACSAFQPGYETSTDGFVAVFGGVPADEPALLASLATPSPTVVNTAAPGTLSLRNAGSAAADDVVASVTLGPGFVFASSTPSQGSCSFSAPLLSCALGSLAPGAEAEVDFLATPAQGGVLGSTAQVSADGAESVRAGACLLAQVNDLAISSLKAPKSLRVPADEGEVAKVRVKIENLGNHPEQIADLDVLGDLVTLDVTASAARRPRSPSILSPGRSSRSSWSPARS